jgi:hypothetical protein
MLVAGRAARCPATSRTRADFAIPTRKETQCQTVQADTAASTSTPRRIPGFDQLPPERDGSPQENEELIDISDSSEAGLTHEVDAPQFRAPVDCRVSRPSPVETKTPLPGAPPSLRRDTDD